MTDNQYILAICLVLFLVLQIYPFPHMIHGKFVIKYLQYILSGLFGVIILFTFFRKNERQFTKSTKIGSILQYIGKRTLDIYLLHYFFLPYHMIQFGDLLSLHSNKSVDVLIILIIALWIIAITLLVSNIIRLSPFLGHYLFGVKNAR